MKKYNSKKVEYNNGFISMMVILSQQHLHKTVEYWDRIFSANKDYFTNVMETNMNLWQTVGVPMMIKMFSKD